MTACCCPLSGHARSSTLCQALGLLSLSPLEPRCCRCHKPRPEGPRAGWGGGALEAQATPRGATENATPKTPKISLQKKLRVHQVDVSEAASREAGGARVRQRESVRKARAQEGKGQPARDHRPGPGAQCSLVAPARGQSSASPNSFPGPLVRTSGAPGAHECARTLAGLCLAAGAGCPGGGRERARTDARARTPSTRAHAHGPVHTAGSRRAGGPEPGGGGGTGGAPERAGTKDAAGRGRPGRVVIGDWGRGGAQSRPVGDWPRPPQGPSRPPRPSRPKPEPRSAARDPPRAPAICAGGGAQAGVGFPPSPHRLALRAADNLCTQLPSAPPPAQLRAGPQGPRQGGLSWAPRGGRNGRVPLALGVGRGRLPTWKGGRAQEAAPCGSLAPGVMARLGEGSEDRRHSERAGQGWRARAG